MNWLGQHQICAEAESLGHARLSFYHRNRQRGLVGIGIARALEQQSRILLIVAIHHDRVEMLAHQFLDCGKWLVAGLNGEVEISQNLAHCAGRFLVRAE